MNIDKTPSPGVDLALDLEQPRLPFPDSSVQEIVGIDLLEHIVNILPLMQELWRVAVPGAVARFAVPFGSSDEADEDPTHVRRFFLNSWGYFSQPFYWRADYGYRGDWKPQRIGLKIDPAFCSLSREDLATDINTRRNVVQKMTADLIAIKPARKPERALQTKAEIVIR